ESVYSACRPGHDLQVFRRWYSQAGTPRVQVQLEHDPDNATATLTLTQSCPPVGIERLQNPLPEKLPLHIPMALGLLTPDGAPISPEGYAQRDGAAPGTVLLELTEQRQSWTFRGIAQRPVLSLLRDFSAPVIVEYDRPDTELALLARQDPDPFARWEAGQELLRRLLLARVGAILADGPAPSSDLVIDTWAALLADDTLSPAYLSRVLSLPAQRELLEQTEPMEPQAVVQAYQELKRELGRRLAAEWERRYETMGDTGEPYSPDPESAGRRALRGLALGFLRAGEHREA